MDHSTPEDTPVPGVRGAVDTARRSVTIVGITIREFVIRVIRSDGFRGVSMLGQADALLGAVCDQQSTERRYPAYGPPPFSSGQVEGLRTIAIWNLLFTTTREA